MKNLLLFSGFALMSLGLSAQERLVLYEEFTGENCPPCAQTNPGLNQLVATHSDVLIIKYQSPIPSGGPIYQQNTSDIQARLAYYQVPFAPYGLIDGTIVPREAGYGPEYEGHAGFTTSALLTQHANVPTNIDVEFVNYNWSTGSNSATFDVKVTSTEAQNLSNTVIHVALLEDLIFTTPPGTTNEKEFYNVVRKMYPGPQGQAVQSSFTANESQTFTYTVDLPSYVDITDPSVKFIAFVQNNGDKKVLNAAVSGWPVSTKELVNQTQLAVYPNPTTTDLNLKIDSDLTGEGVVLIHDVLGRQVYESKVDLNGTSSVKQISVNKLAAGVYTIQLNTENSSKQIKFTKL